MPAFVLRFPSTKCWQDTCPQLCVHEALLTMFEQSVSLIFCEILHETRIIIYLCIKIPGQAGNDDRYYEIQDRFGI